MRDERERLPYDARLELPPLVVQAVGVGEGDGRVRPDDPRRHRGAVAVLMDELNSTRYTNQELYDKMGPDSMAMPYVYQDFDWDHCSHAGFDFTGIDTSAEVTDDVLDMTPTDVDEAAAPPSLDDDADDARRKLTGASMTREEIVAFRWQLYKMTVPEYIQDLF